MTEAAKDRIREGEAMFVDALADQMRDGTLKRLCTGLIYTMLHRHKRKKRWVGKTQDDIVKDLRKGSMTFEQISGLVGVCLYGDGKAASPELLSDALESALNQSGLRFGKGDTNGDG